jgi:hypothetical protein
LGSSWEIGREIVSRALWSADPDEQVAIGLLLVVGGLAVAILHVPIALLASRLTRLNRALAYACRTHECNDSGDLDFGREDHAIPRDLRQHLRAQVEVLIRHSPVSVQFEDFHQRWERSRDLFGGESAAVRFSDMLRRRPPLERGLRSSLAPALAILFLGLSMVVAIGLNASPDSVAGAETRLSGLPVLVWGLLGSMGMLIAWRALHGSLVGGSESLCELVELAFPASDATDVAAELQRANARELERLSDQAEQLNRALNERLDEGLAQLARALDKALETLSEGQEEVLATLLEPEAEDAWAVEPAAWSRAAILPRSAPGGSADIPPTPSTLPSPRWSLGRVVGEMRGAWKRVAGPHTNQSPSRETPATGTTTRYTPLVAPAAEKAGPTRQSATPPPQAAGVSEVTGFDFLKPLISSSGFTRPERPESQRVNSLSGGLLHQDALSTGRKGDSADEPWSRAPRRSSKQSE